MLMNVVGGLTINHNHWTMSFDCSFTDSDVDSNKAQTELPIKWAAFYGDCDTELTSAHCVTLVYTLHVTQDPAVIPAPACAIDFTKLPLYKVMGGNLRFRDFMRHGKPYMLYP